VLVLKQLTGTIDITGGQHDPIALNIAGESPVHPLFDHEPDSPSPLVLNVTDKLEPGVQTVFVFKVAQKFHLLFATVPVA
jgi:hypothetical protein